MITSEFRERHHQWKKRNATCLNGAVCMIKPKAGYIRMELLSQLPLYRAYVQNSQQATDCCFNVVTEFLILIERDTKLKIILCPFAALHLDLERTPLVYSTSFLFV